MNLRVLVLVALITAFAPLSMDLYLPGLPNLRADLDASDQQAQMTVTLCIVGLALGQFATSLIPDRYGRRRPLVVGMIGWVIATVLCALAPNITVILALRLCQGLGAGVAIALARTVVADLDPDNLSLHLARMMLVLSVVPVLAPVIGGVVVSVTNWRGLFGGLAATGSLLLLVMILALPESHQPGQTQDASEPLFGPVKHLVRSPAFLLPAVISGTGFGVTFSFVGDSAFVFRGHYGLGPVPYGLIFGLDALAMIAGLQTGPILERRIGTKALLLVATSVGAAGAVAMLVFAVVTPHVVALVVASLMLTLLGGGAVIPVATAAAIDAYPGGVSAASGVCGAFQFLLGGLLGALPTLLPFGDGAGPLAAVCMVCVSVGHALSRDLKRAPLRNAQAAGSRNEPIPVPGALQLAPDEG
jgi:MFS transporter, DHA1 family, multidrug resistance protein